MNNEEMLAIVENLLRTMPDLGNIKEPSEENLGWFGRLLTVIDEWDLTQSLLLQAQLNAFHDANIHTAQRYIPKILAVLHHARQNLILKTKLGLRA